MRVSRRLRWITRLARSLKSNDLAHFTDFYPRRALATTSVRRTAWTHLYRCRVGGADDDEYDDDEPFYRIRRRGLFRFRRFRRALVRRTNRLVWNHRTMQGGEICDDEKKIQARIEIKKTILLLAFSAFVYNLAHSESIPYCSIVQKREKIWKIRLSIIWLQLLNCTKSFPSHLYFFYFIKHPIKKNKKFYEGYPILFIINGNDLKSSSKDGILFT